MAQCQMKKTAPKKFTKKNPTTVYTAKKTVKQSRRLKFPNILRFITEKRFTLPSLDNIFLVSFVSGMLLMGVILSVWKLTQDAKEYQRVQASYGKTQQAIAYWGQVVKERPDYRDAYYQLAVLSLQIGDKQKAREYITESLGIDPNFEAGNKLLAQLKNN